MDAISHTIEFNAKKVSEGELKYIYKTIYYCRKVIKLSENHEEHKDGRGYALKMLSSLYSLCGVCCKMGKGYKQCSRCTCVYYCSVDCQRKHWKEGGHKDECKKLDF